MIHVIDTHYPYDHNEKQTPYYTIKVEGEESRAAFTLMVQKALNCWPDAHPALKELGDMLTHGRVLQDYWSSRTDVKTPKN